MTHGRPRIESNSGKHSEQGGWWWKGFNTGERILLLLGVLILLASLLVPEVRQFLHLEEPKSKTSSQPANPPQVQHETSKGTQPDNAEANEPQKKTVPNATSSPQTPAPEKSEWEKVSFYYYVEEVTARTHLIKRVEPIGTPSPNRSGSTADIFVRVPVSIVVGEDGKIVSAEPVKAEEATRSELKKAVGAAKQWEYTPFAIDERVTRVRTIINLDVVRDGIK